MPCLPPQALEQKSRRKRRARADGLALGNLPNELAPSSDEGQDTPLFGLSEGEARRQRMKKALAMLAEGYHVSAAGERFGFSEHALYSAASKAGIPLR